MALPIIPGANNELITGSLPAAYPTSGTSTSLSVIFLTDGTYTLSEPTSTDNTAIYAINSWNDVTDITLPPSNGNMQFLFKKIDASSNPVTIYGYGSNKIDGSATYELGAQWDSVRIVSYTTASWLKF
jgi:hypothetical protein